MTREESQLKNACGAYIFSKSEYYIYIDNIILWKSGKQPKSSCRGACHPQATLDTDSVYLVYPIIRVQVYIIKLYIPLQNETIG